jgi:hypothetical protein
LAIGGLAYFLFVMKQDLDLLRTASLTEKNEKMAIAEDNEQLTLEEKRGKVGWSIS